MTKLGKARPPCCKRFQRSCLSAPERAEPARWMANPIGLGRVCDAGVQALIALPAGTPWLRLLADQTAKVLAGVSHALNGLALLVDESARPVPRRHGVLLLCAGLASRSRQRRPRFRRRRCRRDLLGRHRMAKRRAGHHFCRDRRHHSRAAGRPGLRGGHEFVVGTGLTAIFAAIIGFAVLPNTETFVGFSLAIGLVLVPAGAGMAQSWQTPMFTAMTAFFAFFSLPTNQMIYELRQFYNAALATVAGLGVASVSFRLLPPLLAGIPDRRLLALTGVGIFGVWPGLDPPVAGCLGGARLQPPLRTAERGRSRCGAHACGGACP